ncbi:MAG: adenine phosphoribosyltransferase [Deltaproteobacteria bacterium]|nr:adenine phosphoribosyltransferase [Deltaproteobacteria bacterium]
MSRYHHIGGVRETEIKQYIRDVPDFPRAGILFKDIAPLLGNAALLRAAIRSLLDRYQSMSIETVVAIESRGFIFGAPLAYELGVPFHMARKKGKLPYRTIEQCYALEYGSATIALHTDAIRRGERVLVIDDLLATGGTAAATCTLVERLGGTVVECAFLIELAFLGGRDRVGDYNVCTVVRYE